MSRYSYDAGTAALIGSYLQEIATVLGAREPSDGVVRTWLRTLSESVPAYAAASVLADWLKSHSRAPTPADVIKDAAKLEERAQERRKASERELNSEAPTRAVARSGGVCGDAFRVWLGELRKAPSRPGKWCLMTGLLYMVDGELPLPDHVPSYEPGWIPDAQPLSEVKRRMVIAQYGEEPSESVVAAVREAVRRQLAAEAKIPTFREVADAMRTP